MSDTVKQAWGLECPKCRSDEAIDINAVVQVRLYPNGTDEREAADASHTRDGDSAAFCRECDYEGRVSHFRVTSRA